MTDMKICSKCGALKIISDFYRDKSRADGYNYSCKTCIKALRVEFRAGVEQGKKAEYQRKYYRTDGGKEATLRAINKYQQSEHGRVKRNIAEQRSRDNLSDKYIKSSIARGRISMKVVPTEMVELKRVYLQIKRELKEKV